MKIKGSIAESHSRSVKNYDCFLRYSHFSRMNKPGERETSCLGFSFVFKKCFFKSFVGEADVEKKGKRNVDKIKLPCNLQPNDKT